MAFDGFPPQTLKFLKGIAANNNKLWFDEHRADYDEFWVEPGKEFVVGAGEKLPKIRKGIHAEPKINGSLFRINRDIRFSKDKTPYKQTLDLWFWEGERKGAVSGFYFRLTPTMVFAGAGAHGFDRDQLARYRVALQDSRKFKALQKAVDAIPEGVSGETFKRTPTTDKAVTEQQAKLLRHSAMFTAAERKVGKWVHTPEVLDWAADQWRIQAPMHTWLATNLAP